MYERVVTSDDEVEEGIACCPCCGRRDIAVISLDGKRQLVNHKTHPSSQFAVHCYQGSGSRVANKNLKNNRSAL